MASAEIIAWLRKKRRNALISSSFYFMAALAGGAVALALTFCLILLAAKILLLLLFPTSHFITGWSLILSSLVMVLIFADGIYSVRTTCPFCPFGSFARASRLPEGDPARIPLRPPCPAPRPAGRRLVCGCAGLSCRTGLPHDTRGIGQGISSRAMVQNRRAAPVARRRDFLSE